MANNRYYIQCPVCDKEIFLGKSLGEGIYNTRGYQKVQDEKQRFLPNDKEWSEGDAELLEEVYTWMWEHMINCHKNELKGGELFKIISEYK